MPLSKQMSGRWVVHLLACVCVLFWGLSFVSTRVLLDHEMGAVEIYVYRFIIAYVLMVILSHRHLLAHTWTDEGLFALCGLCSGSIYYIAENTALDYTLVTNVSLLTAIAPLITAMLAGFLYKNERPSRGMLLGSSVAFLGVACVIFNSASSLEVRPLGDILSLAAAFSWAIYSLILRRLSANYDVMFITRKTFFYGLVTALPFLAFAPRLCDPFEVLSNPQVLSNLLFLGIGASMLGFLLWSFSVKKLGAIQANNYLYLQPVVTLVASAVLLGEAVTFIGVLGCALILAGLWLGDKLTRRN